VRDSVFQSLLLEKNRQVEPWTQMSLGFLNHYSRQESSLEYIKPDSISWRRYREVETFSFLQDG
jgi:hypothetical protein